MKHIKDAYYFSHDSNAKDDPKCVLLIEQLGLEGYGIFWVLIETLREQPNFEYPLELIPALARRYNTTAEKMKTVVMVYNLFFVKDDKIFFSESLNRRMNLFLEKRHKLSLAGRKGAQIKKDKKINLPEATLKPSLSYLETSKEKENKTKENLFYEEIDVEDLNVPDDGVNRNLEGVIRRLKEYKISPEIIKEVIELSNYGEIGTPVWKYLDEIRDKKDTIGAIKFPTAFLKKKLGL